MRRETSTPVRKKRLTYDTWAIVLDEIVEIKDVLFNIYPDLKDFLTEGHKKFLTGEIGNVKNEWGEWEEEPFYKYTVKGPDKETFSRNYCNYTACCNGYLMQSPAAMGAKHAMYNIVKKYYGSKVMIPQVFIHDEIVFEVLDGDSKYAIIKDVADIMITSMQKCLPNVRVAVEADGDMGCWMKAGGGYTKTFWKNPYEGRLYEK
jgi:hypothetical protein